MPKDITLPSVKRREGESKLGPLVEQLVGQQGERGANWAGVENSRTARLLQALGAAGRAAATAPSSVTQPTVATGDRALLAAEQLRPALGTGTAQTPGSLPIGLGVGAAEGLLRDPVAGRLLQGPLDVLTPGEGSPVEKRLAAAEQLAELGTGRRGYAFGKFLGEEAPTFAGSLKLMSSARSLVEHAVELAGPKLAAKASASRMGSLAREGRKLEAYLESTAPRGAPAPVGTFLRRPETAPLSHRLALGAGNVAGFAGYEGIDAALDYQPEDDVGTVGSRVRGAAGLAALVELAIVGGSRVVSRFGRRVNLAEALDNYRTRVELPELREGVREVRRTKFNDATDRLSRERLALDSQRSMLQAVRDLQATRSTQLGRQQARVRVSKGILDEYVGQQAQVSSRVVRSGALSEEDYTILQRVSERGRTAQRAAETLRKERNKGAKALAVLEPRVRTAQERVLDAQVVAAQSENALRAWNEGWMFYPENAAALNRTLPYNPRGPWREVQKWLLDNPSPIGKTPQDFAGRLGLSGVRFTGQLGRSEADATVGAARATDQTHKFLQEAASLRGVGAASDGAFMEDAVELYVKGRDAELVARYGQPVFDHLERTSQYTKQQYERLVPLGGRPWPTQQELAENGVVRHWPQAAQDIDRETLDSQLMAAFRNDVRTVHPRWKPQAVELEATKRFARYERNAERGLGGYPAFDQGRLLPGSALDKIDKGMSFERDPYRALEQYLVGIERKHAFASRWGYRGEVADAAVKMVGAEGGPGAESIAQSISDIFFDRTPASVAARRMAEYATSAQVAMKMPFAALLNAGQSTQTLAVTGANNVARGLQDLGRREGIARLNHEVNLAQGLFQGLRDIQLGGYSGSNWLSRLVDWELRALGFTPTERVNRLIAGAGFGHLIHDTLAQSTTGRLRGVNLETARRLFSSKLDADLDTLTRLVQRGGRIDPEEFDRMVYRGAQLSQFMPDLSRRPGGWNTPTGRVISQFLNFVLAQTHFMRNEVLGEAARGNYQPLATVVALYPTVGSFMQDALGWVKDRKAATREPWQTIDAVTLMGGLGMVTTLGQAAMYQRGAEALWGPTIGGTLVPTVESAVRAAMGDMAPAVKQFERTPIVVLGNRALDVTEWTLDHFEAFQSELDASSPTAAPTLELMRTRRAVAKPQ